VDCPTETPSRPLELMDRHFIQMSGNEVFKHAVRRMISSTKTALKKADLEESDITWLIPHQANLRIIEAIAKRFSRVDPQKVIQEGIKKYGNTSASSVCIVFPRRSIIRISTV